MRTMRLALLAALCLVLGVMVMPGRADDGANPDPLGKITFSSDQLDQEGLTGPPDGLRALDYEFCIPGDAAHAAQGPGHRPHSPDSHPFPGVESAAAPASTSASAAPTSQDLGRCSDGSPICRMSNALIRLFLNRRFSQSACGKELN